jgi:WD40 repeat protein
MAKESKSDGNPFVELIARELPIGKQRFSIKVPYRRSRALAVSPGGQILASSLRPDFPLEMSFDDSIVLWDTASGRKLLTMQIDDGWINSLAFSPDGRTLISGMANGTALVWDVAAVYGKLGH